MSHVVLLHESMNSILNFIWWEKDQINLFIAAEDITFIIVREKTADFFVEVFIEEKMFHHGYIKSRETSRGKNIYKGNFFSHELRNIGIMANARAEWGLLIRVMMPVVKVLKRSISQYPLSQ